MPEEFLGLFESETDVVVLQPGEELFRKGDAAHHAYIVKSGKLQIFDENRILETVTAGGILGEMARSAMMPGAQPLAPSVNV